MRLRLRNPRLNKPRKQPLKRNQNQPLRQPPKQRLRTPRHRMPLPPHRNRMRLRLRNPRLNKLRKQRLKRNQNQPLRQPPRQRLRNPHRMPLPSHRKWKQIRPPRPNQLRAQHLKRNQNQPLRRPTRRRMQHLRLPLQATGRQVHVRRLRPNRIHPPLIRESAYRPCTGPIKVPANRASAPATSRLMFRWSKSTTRTSRSCRSSWIVRDAFCPGARPACPPRSRGASRPPSSRRATWHCCHTRRAIFEAVAKPAAGRTRRQIHPTGPERPAPG